MSEMTTAATARRNEKAPACQPGLGIQDHSQMITTINTRNGVDEPSI